MPKMIPLVALLAAVSASAQTTVQVTRADLAVPFGSVSGKVVAVGDSLVFVDDERPEASFALSRADIQSANLDNGMLTVQTRRPVRDRSGERTSLVMRVGSGADATALSGWLNATTGGSPAAMTPVTAPAGAAPSAAAGTGNPLFNVEARHRHRIRGGCRGRLVLTETGLAYESVDEINDSRQWSFRDLKEMKHSSPYALEIEPFNGAEYKFDLQGSGMDNQQYKLLVDRVTAARAAR